MKKWEEQGCEYCRKLWLQGDEPPKIADSFKRHASLHLCPKCNTYWESHVRFAAEISIEEAAEWYGI